MSETKRTIARHIVLQLFFLVFTPSALKFKSPTSLGGVASHDASDLCKSYKSSSLGYEFCTMNIADGARAKMNEYRKRRSACALTYTPSRRQFFWGTHGDDAGYERLWQSPHPERYLMKAADESLKSFLLDTNSVMHDVTAKLEECSYPISSEEKMHIYRIGPFRSFGGGLYSRFIIKGALSDYGDNDVGVTSYLQAPVDSSGLYLGRPPIQIHHNHLTTNQVGSLYGDELQDSANPFAAQGFEILADTHGDRQCKSHLGGTDCLLRTLPANYSTPVRFGNQSSYFADYVDVRDRNSPELQFWVENMVTVTRVVNYRKALGFALLVDYHIKSIGRPEDAYAVYKKNFFVPDDYVFNTATEGIAWRSYSLPAAGRAVFTYFHSHNMFTNGVWLIRATPSELGLPEMELLDTTQFKMRDLSKAPEGLDMIKEKLRLRAERDMICQRPEDIFEHVNYTGQPYVSDKYERFVPPSCPEWEFEADEVFTLISFHRTGKPFEALKDHVPAVPMHAVLYLYWLPKTPDRIVLRSASYAPLEQKKIFRGQFKHS